MHTHLFQGVWLKIILILKVKYFCWTTFGKKYYHFSLLCKQMDSFLGKLDIVRKVTSAPTCLA